MSQTVVSQQEWVSAQRAHLAREDEFARLRGELLAARRALPWVKVEKAYVFEGPNGPEMLADLFDGRSRLIVQHFMFNPAWDEGCPGCSFGADHIGPTLAHIENNDLTYVAISRAPLAKLQAYQARMGWSFKWVSSAGSDFNFDFQVSFTPEQIAAGKGMYNFDEADITLEELPGWSVFVKNDAGEIFRTFSAFGRGVEDGITTNHLLELAPAGEFEMNRHDAYPHQPVSYVPSASAVPVVSGGSGCGCGCGS